MSRSSNENTIRPSPVLRSFLLTLLLVACKPSNDAGTQGTTTTTEATGSVATEATQPAATPAAQPAPAEATQTGALGASAEGSRKAGRDMNDWVQQASDHAADQAMAADNLAFAVQSKRAQAKKLDLPNRDDRFAHYLYEEYAPYVTEPDAIGGNDIPEPDGKVMLGNRYPGEQLPSISTVLTYTENGIHKTTETFPDAVPYQPAHQSDLYDSMIISGPLADTVIIRTESRSPNEAVIPSTTQFVLAPRWYYETFKNHHDMYLSYSYRLAQKRYTTPDATTVIEEYEHLEGKKPEEVANLMNDALSIGETDMAFRTLVDPASIHASGLKPSDLDLVYLLEPFDQLNFSGNPGNPVLSADQQTAVVPQDLFYCNLVSYITTMQRQGNAYDRNVPMRACESNRPAGNDSPSYTLVKSGDPQNPVWKIDLARSPIIKSILNVSRMAANTYLGRVQQGLPPCMLKSDPSACQTLPTGTFLRRTFGVPPF